MSSQIAVAVLVVSLIVGGLLAFGTLFIAARSFAELMVEHGETLVAAQAMFRDSVAGFFIAALAVGAAASLALAVVVGRRVASPLREMRDAARQLAQGDHGIRVRSAGPEEVRSLAESFNRMAAEIESQERLRREFVANAAHELRTPLTNLLGYLEALSDGLVTPDRLTLGSLREEVDRLVRLSRSLDALAKGDVTSRPAGEVREMDLRAALVTAVEVHTAAFERRRLRVHLDVPRELGARADPDHVAQVLSNLFQNAVRYTSDGGDVTVTASRRASDVLVSVSNTGLGIPREDLPHVFERFFTVDRSRDRATAGAGIGLAIVKSLIELAGGRVGVESDKGVTRFWFSLPA